jgi:hypothetical protein
MRRALAALLMCLTVALPSAAQDAITRTVASFAPQTPGQTDIYMLGVAGDGKQWIFEREARHAARSFDGLLGTGARTLLLINQPEIDLKTPIATRASVTTAIKAIGQALNPAEDILLLFFTSHGWKDGTISLAGPGGDMPPLSATDVAQALDAAGIKRAVIVVSACFSGTWIAPLASPDRIVLTAARPDRTSFGCSDDRWLTYFGQALFENGTDKGVPLLPSFARAQALVKDWELRDGFAPSEPQSAIGARLGKEWSQIERRLCSANPQPACPVRAQANPKTSSIR